MKFFSTLGILLVIGLVLLGIASIYYYEKKKKEDARIAAIEAANPGIIID